jgi:hypothetical protein
MIHGVQKIFPANMALDDFRALKLPLKKVYNPVVGIAINKPVVFINNPNCTRYILINQPKMTISCP